MSDSTEGDWRNCKRGICPDHESPYNYRPNLAANVYFAAHFGLAIPILAFMMWKHKTWSFSTVVMIGCAMEVVGYVGRILAYNDTWNEDLFLIQICCLTIAPVFFAAGIYLCLSRIVTVYGREHSRISPKAYTWIFVTADFISLVLQATGGAIASIRGQQDLDVTVGNNIMIAGLIFQVVTLTVFIAACTEFYFRVQRGRRNGLSTTVLEKLWQRKVFLWSLGLATIAVLVRSVFRVAELWEGWEGPLMRNERAFVALEGAMIAIAVVCFTAINPGWGFKDGHVWRFGDVSLRKKKEANKEMSSSDSD